MKITTDEQYKTATKEADALLLCGDQLDGEMRRRYAELVIAIQDYEEYRDALAHIKADIEELEETGARSLKALPDGEQRFKDFALAVYIADTYEETLTDWELSQDLSLYNRVAYWLRQTIARVIDWIDAELWYERALWRPRWTTQMREERSEEARSTE